MRLHIVIDHADLAEDVTFYEVFTHQLRDIIVALASGETKGEEHRLLEQGRVDMSWVLVKHPRVKIFPTAYAVQDRDTQSGYILTPSLKGAAEKVERDAALTPWVWKVAVVPFEELAYAPATLKPKESS